MNIPRSLLFALQNLFYTVHAAETCDLTFKLDQVGEQVKHIKTANGACV